LVERRQASAPEAEGRRKPPFPWRALCAACVQVVDYASAGVPFPFFYLFVIASEAKQSSPAATFWIASSLRSSQ
jgi:hypothetical protein